MKNLFRCFVQGSRNGSGPSVLNHPVADQLSKAGLMQYCTPLGSLTAASPQKTMPKVKMSALETLVNDDAVAEAHMTLGIVRLFYDWDWFAAEKQFKRSLELNPYEAPSHQLYAFYLAIMGRLDEAVIEARRAQEIDPGSVVIDIGTGWVLYFARQYNDAIEQICLTLERQPDSAEAHTLLRLAYEKAGRFQEALADWQKQMMLAGRSELADGLRHAYDTSGYRGVLLKLLQRAERVSRHAYLSPAIFSLFHARLRGIGPSNETRHREQALRWLEKAFQERCSYLPFLNADPLFDSFREDYRFIDLVQKIGLDQLSSEGRTLPRPFAGSPAENPRAAVTRFVGQGNKKERWLRFPINNFTCHCE
jgi:tetratricopeptide (TPR) repeat protein